MDHESAVRHELREIRELMSEVEESDWDRASTCEGFRVRDVVGHLTVSRHLSTGAVLGALVRQRGDLAAVADRASVREGGRPVGELLALLDEAAARPRWRGVSRIQRWPAMLGDVATHQEDLRWSLRRRRTSPSPRADQVLDTVLGLRGLESWGADARAEGLTLHATDTGWRHGRGPEVHGTADVLLMALGGRRAAAEHLTGDGAELLAAR